MNSNPTQILDDEARACAHIVSHARVYPGLRAVATISDIARAVDIMRVTGHRPDACLILAIAERINHAS